LQQDQLISNPRISYPPLAGTEYTPQAIEEMMEFYVSFPSPGFQGAPVEIMRGCSHSCVFCSEPHVVGKQVKYRDLSAVMADIEMLVDHGIARMYMISSELNPEGNEFVLELADRIRSFNERQTEDQKVTWFGANYLLNFRIDEYERLYKSGFTGGWFDVTALDDENARAMRTPYRNESLLAQLKTYAQFERPQAQEASQPKVIDGENDANREDRAINWSLFLGNPATTPKTVRNTLRVANREGLAQLFTGCGIITNLRVFDYEKPDEATLAVTYSVTADLGRTGYQQLLPSFAYSPALLEHFGSEEEIVRMFGHIAETYLSNKYQKSRDWHSFVKQNATAASIASWMAELSDTKGVGVPRLLQSPLTRTEEWSIPDAERHLATPLASGDAHSADFATTLVGVPAHIRPTTKGKASAALQQLFSKEPQDKEKNACENLAKQVVDSLLFACLEAFPDLLGSLGLPSTMDKLERLTPYELAVTVYGRWCTEKELVDELLEQTQSVLSESMQDLLQFCIEAMLYRFNVLIRPRYRELFVPAGLSACTIN
jgi:hypothetical protein